MRPDEITLRPARLFREARPASLLDHPHICTVYDIEDRAAPSAT